MRGENAEPRVVSSCTLRWRTSALPCRASSPSSSSLESSAINGRWLYGSFLAGASSRVWNLRYISCAFFFIASLMTENFALIAVNVSFAISAALFSGGLDTLERRISESRRPPRLSWKCEENSSSANNCSRKISSCIICASKASWRSCSDMARASNAAD